MTTVRRILVADDEAAIRDLLAFNLDAEGFEVVTASDGVEARQLALEGWADVILLDVMMPGLDGLDVLAAVKANQATSEVPVVLLTAKAADSEIWAGWQAGADYYITKPFELDEVLAFLHYVAQESERASG